MKRIISFVLCLSMLISMLPVSVFAAEAEETVVPETTAATEAPQEPETEAVTEEPTEEPTEAPTEEPTEAPAEEPTVESTEVPTEVTEAPAEASNEAAAENAAPTVETEPEETEPEVETAVMTSISGSFDAELPSDEELFAVYADSVLYGTSIATLGTAAGEKLSGDVKLAYDALVPLIREIAAGERDSAVVSIGHNIGKVSVNGVVSTYTPDVEVAFTGTTFGYDELVQLMGALLSDMPYELYWMDKVSGYSVVPLITSSGKMYLTFSFCVSADYSATGAKKTYDLDTAVTGAATQAADNAQEIVAEFAGESDYDKLVTYKDRICELTSYNSAAAGDPSTPYGDPWQLIYVFDGDVSTTVVCEGYAKAFQYLCDLSAFEGDITCCSVTGDMTHNGKSGAHMWNIVTIEGANYLVDVTNCDTGFDLFLAGAEAESDGSYTIDGANFAYDEDTLNAWNNSILALASDYYNPIASTPDKTVPEETVPEGTVPEEGSAAAKERFLAAMEAALAAGEDVHLTEDVVLDEDVELALGEYNALFIDQGVTLTIAEGAYVSLQAPMDVEGGSLLVNGQLYLANDLTLVGNAVLTVGGTLIASPGTRVQIQENAGLNINQGANMSVETDETGSFAWLRMWGTANINGTLNVDGEVQVGDYEMDMPGHMILGENGSINVSEVGQFGVYPTAQLDIYGTNFNVPYVLNQGTMCFYRDMELNTNIQNNDTIIVASGLLDIYSSIYNNGTFQVENGAGVNVYGTFEGNDPAVAGEGCFTSPLSRFLASVEAAVEGDVFVTESITLKEDLTISIPGVLYFDMGSRLEIPEGVTLTLDCQTVFSGADLQVTGKLVNNGALDIHDYLIDETGELVRDGTFTVDGYFDNYGTCRILNGAEMNVNYTSEDLPGCAMSYGTFETGSGNPFDIYGQLHINSGSFEIYGYAGIQGSVSIYGYGWLTVGDVYTFEDGTETYGHMDILGSVYVEKYGYLNVAGGLTLGNDETGYALIEISEDGQMWVSADVMWCDILATGALVNYGTLTNEGIISLQGTFENYGTVNGNMPISAAQSLIAELTGDGDVVIRESITLDDDIEIRARTVTIENGAVLTLNGSVQLSSSGGRSVDLYVDGDGSKLVINGNFFAGLSSDSFFTNGAELVVNGFVEEWRGNLIIGGAYNEEGGYEFVDVNAPARVTVNGTMNKSYNCSWIIYPGSELYVAENATLILDSNGEVDGSLDLWSDAVINGTVDIRGGLRVGSEEHQGINLHITDKGALILNHHGQLSIAPECDMTIDGPVSYDDYSGYGVLGSHVNVDGTLRLNTDAEIYGHWHGEGTLYANSLHYTGEYTSDSYTYYNNLGFREVHITGQLDVDGENFHFDNLYLHSGETEGGAQMNIFSDLENQGMIHVEAGASLTVHDGATLVNTADEGWQQDDGIFRSHLFVRGQMFVNGTLDNYGYISVGDFIDDPDPYAGNECIQISPTGTLINHEDGAFDIAPSGCLDMRGTAENYGVGNGICNDGLIWLDGKLDSYGHLYNGGGIHTNYFHEDEILGELVIHEGAVLDNYGMYFLENGGNLTVSGEMVDHWIDAEHHATVHLNGNVLVNGRMQTIGELHIPATRDDSNAFCTVTISETGRLINDHYIFIHDRGTMINNGYVEYGADFIVEEGGSFTGNAPVSKGFENLMADFGHALEQGEGLWFEGSVIVPEGEYTFSALAEDKELGLGGKLVVPSGATLILDCPVGFYGGELIVEEGGTLISNVNLSLGARDGDYSRHSTATIDGELISNGSVWMVGRSEMTVNGYLRSGDAMHIGFDGGATLNVNGTMDNFGYLNVVADGSTALNIGAGGVLNIDIFEDENGEITNVGFLQAANDITVDGTLNLYGLCVLGDRETEGGDVGNCYITVNEGGVLNIEAKYRDPRATLTLLTNGRVQVKGTLKQRGNSFIDLYGGSIELLGNGVYDENAGYGFINNYLAQSFIRDPYYGYTSGLPMDRVTIFADVGSMDEINWMLAEFEEGGYTNGTIRIRQDFTLYEDLELPEGVALLIMAENPDENDPITFTIEQGITLTTHSTVQMAQYTELINNGSWSIQGDMAAFSDFLIENNGEIGVAPTGSITLEDPDGYQGEGDLYAMFVSTEEHAKIEGIGLDQVCLANSVAATEQDIRDTLDFAAENGYGTVQITLFNAIELTADLTIPDNAHIQCFSVFTVPEGITVTNQGSFYFTDTLVINGTWVGTAPTGTSFASLTGPGSYRDQAFLEEVLADAAAAGEEACFTWNLILEEDLELNQPLNIYYSAYIEIPEGVTLTIGENGALTVYGELAADDGGKIVNNGYFRCELNGYAHMAEDAYTAGENSILLTDFIVGWIADLGGPVFGEQTLYMENCTTEEELRTLINWVQDKGYKGGLVRITSDITLSSDLEIPENVTVIIESYASLIVPEEFTVTNNGTVENKGRLGINGIWTGKGWIGNGEVVGVTQTISQEDFLRMMEEAEEQVILNQSLTLTEDLVLDKYLIISEYGSLVVPEGITLTNGDVIDVCGTLLVEEGATLDNGGNHVWTDIRGTFLMEGQYIGDTYNWNVQRDYDGYDAIANVQGFEPGEMLLCGSYHNEEQLRNLIDMCQSEGYCNGAAFLFGNMSISSDLYIPGNVYVEIFSEVDDQGNWNGKTVTVQEGAGVTNDGLFVVARSSTLVVDGWWEGNDPIMADGASIIGNYYYMSQDELESMLAEQGEVILKKTVVLDHDMVLNGQLYLESFGHLVVPEGVTLTVNGLLEVNYTGQVTVEGTIYNAGTINAHMDGHIDVTGGNYAQEDWAEIKLALWGENGERNAVDILGVPNYMLTVTVDGNDEDLIREALDMGAEAVGINLYTDLVLSRNLYLTNNVTLNIGTDNDNYATLTVPYGTTLTNDGRIDIGHHGALVIEGKLEGNLPQLNDETANFTYAENSEIVYSQEMLEAALARASETGDTVALSIPLTLTGDLVIPENTTLVISGDSLTVPAGRTLTVNGWIDVTSGGTLICQKGGTVINNCGLSALMGGTIDMVDGTYIHNEGSRVHKHFRDWGRESTLDSTVRGIPFEYISKYYDGWDEAHLRTALLRTELLEAKELNVTINGEMTLTEDMTIPENVYFRICDGGVLTVPSGITLTNLGRIDIDSNGTLIIRSGGALEGYQPLIVSQANTQYINENVYTEDDLRSDIAAAAETGHEIFVSSNITLTADLEIPEGAVITFSGATLEIPAGVTLTNHGQLWTMQGGTIQGTGGVLVNDNLICVHEWGCLYMDDPANFQPTDRAETRFVHYGDQWGNVSHPTVDGILPEHMTIVVNGCNEDNLREVLDYGMGMANNGTPPKRFEINITDGELRLNSDLDIPDYAQLNVGNFGEFPGTLIVPEGVTLNNYGYITVSDGGWLVVEPGGSLTNRAGAFDILWDGHVHIQEGAQLKGSHPVCVNHGSEYINDNHYDQDYLEAQLAEAAANGSSFVLSAPIRLERDLEIPENAWLLITGRDNFLTIPDGVTVTNKGFIVCHMFGGILAEQGGVLKNENSVRAMNWGIVDMSAGEYVKLGEGMVYNHHWAYLEGDNISHPTVLGISPDCLTFEMEGDNDYIFHELIGHIGNMLDNGEEPAGFNGTVTGDMRMTSDIYWPGCGYMKINEGCSLTVSAGTTLYLYGILDIQGQLIVEEGGRVIAYRPIEVTREDAIVNNSGYPINWYNPDVALERFEVSTDLDRTHYADISIDVCEPEGANVVDIQYRITEGSAALLIDRYSAGSDNFIVSRENQVSIYGTASGTVTVEVTPVLGYDEYDEPILSELSDSVTITVPQLRIDAMGGEHPMDFIANSHPGLYAGNTMQFYGQATDVETGEMVEKEVLYALSGDSEQYATLEVIDGICHLTANADLDEPRDITVTMDAADGTTGTITMPVTLMPKPESVDILRNNEEIVTGKTILFDLNREGYNAWLQTATDPACAALANDNASRYDGGQIVHWDTSDEEIATVDPFGNVYFQGGLGEVTISMTTWYDEARTVSVTFNVVKLPQAITFRDDARISMVGGSVEDLFVLDQDTGEIVDNSMIRWTLCDRFGDPIDSHAYASITESITLATKSVADETKVFLMAQVIGDEDSARLEEPVEVTLYPAVSFVQILDVTNSSINGKHLLYDLNRMPETYQLSCSAIPCAEAVGSVIWESDNTDVASIDDTGLITVTGEHGDASFTMTVTDLAGNASSASFKMSFGIFTNSFRMTAQLPDGTVTDELEDLVIYGGESLRFTAENLDYYGSPIADTNGVSWSVSGGSAASISSRGVLTTRTVTVPTKITVTVSSKDQFCSYEIPVTLLPAAVETENGTMDALVIRTDFFYVSGTTYTIAVNGGETLYAVDARTGEVMEDVVWTSSNEAIAHVNEDGWVQAYATQASCTITATDGCGRKSSFTLKVDKRSEHVEISSGTGIFAVASGNSLALAGTVLYSDGSTDKNVTWSMTDVSGNPVRESVAALSENGVLTAAEGLTRAVSVTVRATPGDGNPLAEEAVTVTILPAATGVEIFSDLDTGYMTDITNTIQHWDLDDGSTFGLTAMVYPYFGDSAPLNTGNAMQDVIWSSSDPTVANVAADGTVTCLKSGTVTITATAASGTGAAASFQLVLSKLMDTLELPETATVLSGGTLDLKALDGYRVDTQAANQALTWTMVLAGENGEPMITDGEECPVPETVATLSDGVLTTTLARETCFILVRAASTDGTDLIAECFVTIAAAQPVAITVQPVDVTVANGETAAVTLEATGEGLTYAWYYKNPTGTKFSLTTAFDGPTYSVTMSATRSGRQVYCVITDQYGNSVQSNTVTLSMITSKVEIVTQPTDVTVANGETAAVTVEATGEGLTYAWYYKNPTGTKFSLTSSFTTNTYSVTMSEARFGRQVYCIITDQYGNSVQSDTVTLNMITSKVEIVTQPTDVNVASGETATVTFEATGEGLTYAWYYKNPTGTKFSLTNAFTTNTYSVTMSEARSGRQVYCVVTDRYGNTAQTDTVTLTMIPTVTALAITKQPTDVSAANGEIATVTVEAEGEGLTYAWYYRNAGGTKFTLTSAFTSNTYSLTMNEARSGRQVYCVITDIDGNSVQSDTVTLTMVTGTVVITKQPTDVSVAVGAVAAVTVEATGEGLTYEWYFRNAGGTDFTKTASFTGPTYSITMTESRSGRQVYCVITDADGNSVQSDTVTLSMISTALTITKQPVDVTVASGETATVTVEATGEGLTYAWYFMNAGGTKFSLTNAFTTNTYSVTMSAARSGRQVYCVITDVDGNSVQSNTVTLTMV